MRVVLDTNIFVSMALGGQVGFLEAALAGIAAYVVSGDSHLLELKTFRGIPILTAREFIERLENIK